MKITWTGSNQTEIETANGTTVLFSYKTPVAAFIQGKGVVKTDQKWSRTTRKHIGAALKRWGASCALEVPQDTLDKLASK